MLHSVLRSLRRRTTTGLYIPELDGLRFVAIGCIFLYHLSGDILRHSPAGTSFNSLLFQLTKQLHVGVPLFFAISGMILSLPFAGHALDGRPSVKLKAYFLRRLTRLEAPYLIALLLFFALKVGANRGSFEQLLPHLFASMAYAHNLIFRSASAINFVAWSLEVEVQFYILVPLLVTIFSIKRASVRRGVILATMLLFSAANVMFYKNPLWDLTILGNFDYFLIGFLLADLHVTGDLQTLENDWWWDVVSICGWPLFALGLVYDGLPFRLALPGVILLLYCAVFKGRQTKRVFSGLVVTSIGGMCYSIYLIHNYVIAATGSVVGGMLTQADFGTRLIVQTVLHAVPVLIASCIFYKLIEQPCMDPEWPTRVRSLLAGSNRSDSKKRVTAA